MHRIRYKDHKISVCCKESISNSNIFLEKKTVLSTEVDATLEVLKTRKQEETQKENNENLFLVDNVNKRIPQCRLKYKKVASKYAPSLHQKKITQKTL